MKLYSVIIKSILRSFGTLIHVSLREITLFSLKKEKGKPLQQGAMYTVHVYEKQISLRTVRISDM